VGVRQSIVAGNWKLHKTPAETRRTILELRNKLAGLDSKSEVLVCPAMACLQSATEAAKDTSIRVGSQNVFWEKSGAFTGEVSVDMLVDLGVTHTLIGHSERRALFGETDQDVARKLLSVLDSPLIPVVCVGEVLEQREAGETREVLERQVKGALEQVAPDHIERVVVAYEPVWAIGTGKTASPETANEAHTLIRNAIAAMFGRSAADEMSILYGGSVKPDNASDLMRESEVDGVLVGGASLTPSDFAAIVKAAG
jgi:triosephosphate isomerase